MMVPFADVMKQLQALAQPDRLEGMARYGMSVENRLGIAIPELRKLAKKIGKAHSLALELWKTGNAEARILAALVGEPQKLNSELMDKWAADFDSWDVCDQVCLNLFDKTPLAWQKVRLWAAREPEYEKRAGYALLACLAWHDKKAKNAQFVELLPVIKSGAEDGRNYVKKAVSWALRQIGKRNQYLNQAALETAGELQSMQVKSAQWIAKAVIKDLTSEPTQRRLAKTG